MSGVVSILGLGGPRPSVGLHFPRRSLAPRVPRSPEGSSAVGCRALEGMQPGPQTRNNVEQYIFRQPPCGPLCVRLCWTAQMLGWDLWKGRTREPDACSEIPPPMEVLDCLLLSAYYTHCTRPYCPQPQSSQREGSRPPYIVSFSALLHPEDPQ